MTKSDLLNEYNKVKDSKNLSISLFIHMPDDSTEVIFNTMGHNKIKYIESTYDENLVHKNSKDIFIMDAMFITDNDLSAFEKENNE